jgi:hypothetical protein
MPLLSNKAEMSIAIQNLSLRCRNTQFDDSGQRILQENTRNRWNMEAVFRPEYCFHKITEIARNRQFPSRFVRPGWYFKKSLSSRN